MKEYFNVKEYEFLNPSINRWKILSSQLCGR